MGEHVTADRLRMLISYVPECRKHCAAPGPDPPSLIQFLLDGWPILWLSLFSYHREVDSDQSHDISFAEFCQMMHNLRSGALAPHLPPTALSNPLSTCRTPTDDDTYLARPRRGKPEQGGEEGEPPAAGAGRGGGTALLLDGGEGTTLHGLRRDKD